MLSLDSGDPMKNFLMFILFATFFAACTKSVEKPAVSISHYSNQVFQINQVVNKLMNEKDVKTMNLMADGVEATRAIGCDAVGEECNAYYEFLNKVVNVTKDGELSPADRTLLEQYRLKLNTELNKSDFKIQQQWKEYINADKRD